ncbi:hypothetical protein ACP4OV_023355 [Aristida adscensionis]
MESGSGAGNPPPPPPPPPPRPEMGAPVAGEAEDEEQVVGGAEEGEDAFDIPSKNASHDRLRRWRLYTLDLEREEENENLKRMIRAHAQLIRARFPIDLEKLIMLNRDHDASILQEVGGVRGLSDLLKSNLDRGVTPHEDELSQRRNIFGANTYPRKKTRSIWRFVFEACQDLTLVILMVAAAISLSLGMAMEGVKDGWYDGGSIFFAVFLVIFVTGHFLAASGYGQSLQFQHLNEEKQNIQVEVIRGGKRIGASIFDLVVGDVIPLKIGDQVPADGILIYGHSLSIDESSMTGESKIVHKDQKDRFLMSGCKVADGYGSILVTGVGTSTEWGLLMANLSEDVGEETPLQGALEWCRYSNWHCGFVGAVLVVLWIRYFTGHTKNPDGTTQFVAGTTGVKHGFMGAIRILTIAVTVVVVAVPEGLPLAVTLAYSMRKMMRDKALVRRLSSCETMGSATTICSDKTGTLTMNKMAVVEAYLGGTKLDPCDSTDMMCSSVMAQLIQGIAHNTTGSIFSPENGGAQEVTGSPTEKAILSWGLMIGMDFKDVRSKSSVLHVLPFNSEKKRGGVAVQVSDTEACIHWKGAAELLLASCSSWLSTDGSVQPMGSDKHTEFRKLIDDMAARSLRCIAFAYCPWELKMVPVEGIEKWQLPEDDLSLIGMIGIKDPCRPGVRNALQLCSAAGVKVRMVTGNNAETAKAIALECGILDAKDVASEPIVIEGKVFREMSEATREEIADKITVFSKRQTEADIGLSMGISGTEVAKESSDIIILDDDFTSVVKVVRWGRSVYANIQKLIQFQLTVNVAALVINVVAAVSSGDVPLNAVELLWVNLIMDTLGALALATEPPTDNLMKRHPVGRREPLVTNVMWRNLFIQALYQIAVLLFNFDGKRILHLRNGSREHSDKVKNTFVFNVFVFCQIFNEFNARKPEEKNVFSILIIEFLGKFFDTARLNLKLWMLSIAIGAVSLASRLSREIHSRACQTPPELLKAFFIAEKITPRKNRAARAED